MPKTVTLSYLGISELQFKKEGEEVVDERKEYDNSFLMRASYIIYSIYA